MKKKKQAARRLPAKESPARYDENFTLVMQERLLRERIANLPSSEKEVRRKLKMWLNYVQEKLEKIND